MIHKKRWLGITAPVLVFILPGLLVYTLILIYPLVDTLRLSLYSFEYVGGPEVFSGLDNFKRLFTNEYWRYHLLNALENNLHFFAIHVLLQNPIGLLIAALLANKPNRIRNLYRSIIFIPTVLSITMVGFMWRLVINPVWGLAEDFMNFFGIGQFFKPWLGLEESALTTLGLISVWQFMGIPMILFYAALIAIPHELSQSAQVDGANGWKIFWRIKFPLVIPMVGITTILTYIGNFNAFDLVYVTQGVDSGPNYSTDLLGSYFFRTFFGSIREPGNITMGSTLGVTMLIIIALGAMLYILWQKRRAAHEF